MADGQSFPLDFEDPSAPPAPAPLPVSSKKLTISGKVKPPAAMPQGYDPGADMSTAISPDEISTYEMVPDTSTDADQMAATSKASVLQGLNPEQGQPHFISDPARVAQLTYGIDLTQKPSAVREDISKLPPEQQQGATDLWAHKVIADREAADPVEAAANSAAGATKAALRGVGLAGPWIDRLMGVGGALHVGSRAPGQEDPGAFGQGYNENLAYQNAISDRFNANHPYLSTALTTGTGIGTAYLAPEVRGPLTALESTAMGAGPLNFGKTLPRQMLAGTVAGAIGGGNVGAANTQDLTNIPQTAGNIAAGVGVGGVGGAATAAALGPLARAAAEANYRLSGANRLLPDDIRQAVIARYGTDVFAGAQAEALNTMRTNPNAPIVKFMDAIKDLPIPEQIPRVMAFRQAEFNNLFKTRAAAGAQFGPNSTATIPLSPVEIAGKAAARTLRGAYVGNPEAQALIEPDLWRRQAGGFSYYGKTPEELFPNDVAAQQNLYGQQDRALDTIDRAWGIRGAPTAADTIEGINNALDTSSRPSYKAGKLAGEVFQPQLTATLDKYQSIVDDNPPSAATNKLNELIKLFKYRDGTVLGSATPGRTAQAFEPHPDQDLYPGAIQPKYDGFGAPVPMRDKAGNLINGTKDIGAFDYSKRALDGEYEVAVRSGDTHTAGLINDFRKEVLNAVHGAYPAGPDEDIGDMRNFANAKAAAQAGAKGYINAGYGNARSQFAGPAQTRESVLRGTQIFKPADGEHLATVAEQLPKDLKGVERDQVKALSIGARESIRNSIWRKPGDNILSFFNHRPNAEIIKSITNARRATNPRGIWRGGPEKLGDIFQDYEPAMRSTFDMVRGPNTADKQIDVESLKALGQVAKYLKLAQKPGNDWLQLLSTAGEDAYSHIMYGGELSKEIARRYYLQRSPAEMNQFFHEVRNHFRDVNIQFARQKQLQLNRQGGPIGATAGQLVLGTPEAHERQRKAAISEAPGAGMRNLKNWEPSITRRAPRPMLQAGTMQQ